MRLMDRLRRLDRRVLGHRRNPGTEAESGQASGRVLVLNWALTFLVLIPVAYAVLSLSAWVGLGGHDGGQWGQAIGLAFIGTAVNVGVSLSQRFIGRPDGGRSRR
jgi:hypothetical protein